tara:strand:- start:10420 stop:11625 length:1206 start_codon:yes stop_codon:yes gene_type:complete
MRIATSKFAIAFLGLIVVADPGFCFDSPNKGGESSLLSFRKRLQRKKEPGGLIDRLEFSLPKSTTNKMKWRQPSAEISLGPLPSWNAARQSNDVLTTLGGSLWPQPEEAIIQISSPDSMDAEEAVLAFNVADSRSAKPAPDMADSAPLEVPRKPNQFLCDPLGLLNEDSASRLGSMLQAHAQQSATPVYLLVLDDEYELTVESQEAWSRASGSEIVLVYRWEHPARTESFWGAIRSNDLHPANANAMLISSLQRARFETTANRQIERFAAELILQIRQAAPIKPFRYEIARRIDPPANLTPVSGARTVNHSSLPAMQGRTKTIGRAPGFVGILYLLGAMVAFGLLLYHLALQTFPKCSNPGPQLELIATLRGRLTALSRKGFGHVLECGLKIWKLTRTGVL